MLKSSVFIIVLLSVIQCTTNPPTPDLPDNILGIKLGMSKEDAENRLREIGKFKENAAKGQQVWLVEKDPRFNSLAIGFDKENRVRYVTAFAENGSVKERVRFTDVGDVSKAKQEITAPHHRYTWMINTADGKPDYFITVYGADPEFLSIYSLAKVGQSEEEEKEN